MNPDIWGPHAWYFIQSALVHMPDDADPSNYVNFLFTLQYVLPCESCRESYSEWIRKNPIPTKKMEMIQWITDLHNSIRMEQGKSTRTVEQVIDHYTKNKNNMIIFLALCVLGIFVLRMK